MAAAWGGGGGDRLHWRVQVSTSSPTEVEGCFDVLWNLECPVGLSQKREIGAHFNEGSLAQFGRSAETK